MGASLLRRLTDSPVALGFAAAAVACVFVALRIEVAGGGLVGSLVVVGSAHALRADVPRGIPLHTGSGYDGQFYYRLALEPLNWGRWVHGIDLDTQYRISRIGYPALSWVLAGAGRISLVPWAMVATNVVALALATGCAGALARETGRGAPWGLLLAGYWGFLWTLGRDLTELVAAASLLGTLLLVRRGRPVAAGVVLALGVLTRETLLVVVAAFFVARVLGWWRRRTAARPPGGAPRPGDLTAPGRGRADVVWLVPALTFGGWQAAVWDRIGTVPVLASKQSNNGPPVVGLVDGLHKNLAHLPSTASWLWVCEVVILVGFVWAAAASLRVTSALFHERAAWLGFVLVALVAAAPIWSGDVGLRSFDELFVMSGLLLLCTPRPLRVGARAVAVMWIVVFVELVLYL